MAWIKLIHFDRESDDFVLLDEEADLNSEDELIPETQDQNMDTRNENETTYINESMIIADNIESDKSSNIEVEGI